MKVTNKMNRWTWLIYAIVLLLAACATGQFPETSTPKLDEEFGKSFSAAKEAQKLNPTPAQKDSVTTAKELAQPYDNLIKGKASSAPLQAPISGGGM